MKRILRKYSNAALMHMTGLPEGFIRGYRKSIFTNAVMNGIESTIMKAVRKYEAG